MTKLLRMGVLSPANIAIKRFLPALDKSTDFIFAGIAVSTPDERGDYENFSTDVLEEKCHLQRQKALAVVEKYGGKIFYSYRSLLENDTIDAVYIPLPPELHYKYANHALLHGKHIFMEKPFTVSLRQTRHLLKIAAASDIAVHENYMFVFHPQVDAILQYVSTMKLGELRRVDSCFGFPLREQSDFRYRKELGGGALLDCGGYTVKSLSLLFDKCKLIYASRIPADDTLVDTFGTVTALSDNGCVLNLAYGMDNAYLCELRLWGTKGFLTADRFFTPPPDFSPAIHIRYSNNKNEEIFVPPVDTFMQSLAHFRRCIANVTERQNNYLSIKLQAERIKTIRQFHGMPEASSGEWNLK